MPIPFIIGAIAVGAAAYGAKKGVDAYRDTEIAEITHREARNIYQSAEKELNGAREKAQKRFEELGELQSRIVFDALKKYQDMVEELDIKDAKTFKDSIQCEEFNLAKTRDSIVSLQTALTGVVGGIAGGVAAGFGAFGGAGLLATASTGTAISTLSGVAATNATLAWFGGGSLAAGGFGIAGGTLVLGSIVAAPVILVAGTIFAASAEKKKYDAEAYLNSIKALRKAMDSESLRWNAMVKRTEEKKSILEKIYVEFKDIIPIVGFFASTKGKSVSQWSESEQNVLKTMTQLAETLVTTINSPLMNDEDKLTIELREHQEKCQELMDQINRKWGN